MGQPDRNAEVAVEVKNCFGCIANDDARILILGTLPGEESLSKKEYYARPRNHFWPIIAAAFDEVLPNSYSDRIAMVTRNRIALWDVLKSAERNDSALDSKIENACANDFTEFFKKHPKIRVVAFNGNNAKKFFLRLVGKTQNIRLDQLHMVTLPSTSPAYARPFEEKAAKWRDALAGATGSI
jgi:TDG/mug DNA glycosylase family protein